MAKKFRIVIIILIAVIIVILTFFIRNKYNIENVNAENNIVEAEDNQKSVYDTNQYQSYKQFIRLINEFPPEALEYKGEISIDDTDYYQYGNEDIKVKVISPDSYDEKNMQGAVDYIVSYRDKTFTFQENIPLHPEDVIIYYVDINKDSTKDVIIKGAPYSGTNSAYYWMRAVNLIYMEEIEIFKTTDSVRLTADQSDTLNKMLEEDMEFQSIFPDYEWMGSYANTLVDCFGNIYYEIGIGKEISYDIGYLLLLFDYHKITHKYDLVDYEYIPRYVSVDR
jgi:hypothetical protein